MSEIEPQFDLISYIEEGLSRQGLNLVSHTWEVETIDTTQDGETVRTYKPGPLRITIETESGDIAERWKRGDLA